MTERELFLNYVRAYNARDVAGLLACFDDSCLFENISGGKVTRRSQGKTELQALAIKSAAAFSFREQKVRTLTGGNGALAAEIEFEGLLQADLAPEMRAGTRLEIRGVSVFEFAGGKIVRLTDYS